MTCVQAQRENDSTDSSGQFSRREFLWRSGGGLGGIALNAILGESTSANGATDDAGFAAVRDKVHVHDLHATILHLLGLDHERLTYRYSGRDFRLTDVHGSVVRDIIA